MTTKINLTAFEPGQRVECVDDAFQPRDLALIPNRPFRGRCYTIRGLAEGGRGVGLLLAEIVNPPIWVGSAADPARGVWRMEPPFLASRFRLIRAPNIDVLRALLGRAETEAAQ